MIIDNSRTALEHIQKLTTAKARHLHIWQLIFTGQFLRALEVGKEKNFGAKTIKGLVLFMLREYEQVNVRRNPKTSIRKVRECFDLLYQAAENGEPLRIELTPLRMELGLDDQEEDSSARQANPTRKEKRIINRAANRTTRTSHTHTRTDKKSSSPASQESSPPARAVYVLAQDPTKRNAALENRALKLREEYPPPDQIPKKDKLHQANQETFNIKAQWLQWIDSIQRRWIGPLDLRDLMRISNTPQYFAQYLLFEYRAQLAKGLSEEDKRSSALALCGEAEAIGREAMILATQAEDPKTKLSALKLGLDSIQRRTSLLGLDSLDLNLRVEKVESSWTERAEKAGLTAADLAKIGDIASRAISKKPT